MKSKNNLRYDENQQTNIKLISTQEYAKYNEQVSQKKDRILSEVTPNEFEISLGETINGKSAGPGDIPIKLVKNGPKILPK